MVKAQCFESCGVCLRGFESRRRTKTTSQQPTQLSILSSSVNEYSEATLRAQAITRGGSSIVKVPGDVPPARVYFFGLLV